MGRNIRRSCEIAPHRAIAGVGLADISS